MAKPILDLDTLTDRLTIILNGKEHWLITPDIMPVLDNRRFLKSAQRQDELASKDDLTAEEQEELARIPRELCRLVLDAPDDVLEAMTDRQRMLVIATAYSTFRNGLQMMAPAPAAPERPSVTAPNPTGVSSSPA